MILREQRNAETQKRQTGVQWLKQRPNSSSRDVCNNLILVFEFCRNQDPPDQWRTNGDVNSPDFNQLKIGLCQPLSQFHAKFSSAQAPSWRRKWQPTPVFLLGKSHGQRSLAGYSPWGCKELDTERLTLSLFQESGALTRWLAAG